MNQKNFFFLMWHLYGRANFAGGFRTNAMTQLNHAASLHHHEPFMLSCYSDDV